LKLLTATSGGDPCDDFGFRTQSFG
jgi:hypothetical protein